MSGQKARRLDAVNWREEASGTQRRQRHVPAPSATDDRPEPTPSSARFGPSLGAIQDRAKVSALRSKPQRSSGSLSDNDVAFMDPRDLAEMPCRLPYDTGETGFGYEYLASEPPSRH